MSVFREHKSNSDRSATDRKRHKEKIEEAIREGIQNIVSEESIIGQNGKKKIKIPVRGIKEYRFIFGNNEKNQQVGSAPSGRDVKRGQSIGKGSKESPGQGGQGGNETGEEYYEVEISLEELAGYLFDDLELPDLEKKRLKKVMDEKFKRMGHRPQGIRPRLSKRETLKNKIKRKSAAKRSGTYDPEEDERFPFHDSDLKYRHVKPKLKDATNAAIFFLMDVSGSMTTQKKYLARSFFFILYQFLRHKYENVEIVFISHSTDAKEVNENDFFNKSTTGGTLISPALSLMSDIIHKRYHPSSWNIYGFHCSDGDNWPEDVKYTMSETQKILDVCQIYGYCEISPDAETWRSIGESSVMFDTYSKQIGNKNFKMVTISEPSDVWPQFKSIFGGKND